MNNSLTYKPSVESEEHWVSISDMMAGLMMIFLFISVMYMLLVFDDKAKIEKIAVTYERMQDDLYADLKKEFDDDLQKWNAEINRETLAFRFKEPDVLFDRGSSTVRGEFKQILDDFFPRYINILTKNKYINDIEEIRIEGHTSSEWQSGFQQKEAYIHNMYLSQSRTTSVLEYILKLEILNNPNYYEWLQERITANGLSSSKLIFDTFGNEDKIASRRVEFRVRTNAEKRIVEIIKRS